MRPKERRESGEQDLFRSRLHPCGMQHAVRALLRAMERFRGRFAVEILPKAPKLHATWDLAA
jgi:hypothetical protein